MPHPTEEACLRACHGRAVACLKCATACLQEPDPKPMARCTALDLEWADHPLASAIVAGARERLGEQALNLTATDLQSITGRGVVAQVGGVSAPIEL